jgi:hypothetical protein
MMKRGYDLIFGVNYQSVGWVMPKKFGARTMSLLTLIGSDLQYFAQLEEYHIHQNLENGCYCSHFDCKISEQIYSRYCRIFRVHSYTHPSFRIPHSV